MCIELLNNETDINNPITQTELAKIISDETFSCDRKTVCRNIKFLQEMGYPIKKTKQGFYLDKQISVEDIAFVKAAILSAKGKSDVEKEELSNNVASILARQYRR